MKNSKQLANELNKSIEMEIYYTPRIGSNESSEIFNENPTVQDIKDLYNLLRSSLKNLIVMDAL